MWITPRAHIFVRRIADRSCDVRTAWTIQIGFAPLVEAARNTGDPPMF